MSNIASIYARQVLDSRGRPTVEVELETTSGVRTRASVPSGASTGSYEAHERRDGNPQDYDGLSVRGAVESVNTEVAAALQGMAVSEQREVDARLQDLDGTPTLSRIGANAILGVSLATCRAAARESDTPLYRHIAGLAGTAPRLPSPMINILSGGMHAGGGMDVQDFLAVPVGASSTEEAIAWVGQLRSAATHVSSDRGLPTLLADEGGLSPGCRTGAEALDLLMESIDRAGFRPGDDIAIAIDVAAHSLVNAQGDYDFAREGVVRTSSDVIGMLESWVREYPIVSIEDGLDEEDWQGWQELTARIGDRVLLIGDDLFTTNGARLARGVDLGAANGILVKMNQNGTLTGTLDVVTQANEAGFTSVVSARSGETEDDFLADLAVATGAGQIKIGSLRCSDRLAKYNQLLRISEDPSLPFAKYSPRSSGAQ